MLESFSTGCHLLLAQAAPLAKDAGIPDPPFYETSMFQFLMLIAAVALGWFLAKTITKQLRLSEYSGRMTIVLVSVLLACLMIWSKWPPKFGVDLRGGINMVGSLNMDSFDETDALTGERPTAQDIIPALIQRVNPSGTKEIMIRALGEDKIEVTIPSVSLQEADETWDRLVKAGKLQFRIVADTSYHPKEVERARELAEQGSRESLVSAKDVDGNDEIIAVWTTLAREVLPEGQAGSDRVAPIKFIPQRSHLVRDKTTGQILHYEDFSSSFTRNAGVGFAKWCKAHNIRSPQILLVQPEEKQNVEGKDLQMVRPGVDAKGLPTVEFETNTKGSSRLGLFTKMNEPDSQGNTRLMGIVLDKQLHSAPAIQEAIYKNGRITGNFSPEEVDELVINLRSGKLDVALNKAPISKDFVNSTLGEELKEKGIWAIASSLILVLVFMLFYYRFAGIVATFGLLLNLVLILALIMAINQPFTLTGLAGLVLTVGMSVDANVLIFERIREELDRGAALRMAIRNGFDKATTTIVDANVTTLITALVLYVIGTEQIKGFSVTLILGILMSMFTAIFVARLIFDIAERKRWLTKLNMTRILDRNKWNFLNKVGFTGVMSALIIGMGIFVMYTLGPRILDQDLRGGSTVRVVFNEPQEIGTIQDKLDEENVTFHEGEKAEFSVTGFAAGLGTGTMDDNKTQFKVDSNLPAWEGNPDEAEFEQLDDLLGRVFKGKLKLHHADVVGGKPASSQIQRESNPVQPASGSNLPAESHGQETPQSPRWESAHWTVPTWSGLAVANSLVTYQEADAGSDDEETASETDAEADAEGEVGQIDDTSIDETESVGNTGLESVKYIDETRTLNVSPPISGKTLQSLIIDAADQIGFTFDDDQIIVDSEDVHQDESAMTTISEKWDVTLNVTKPADADAIIAAWAGKFNQKPYFPTSSKVGGQIAKGTQKQAMVAVIASLLGIIAYVWIRFQNVAFGLAAVVALIHDVLVVLGAIALSHWLASSLGFLGITEFKISLEIVAALLTVIGYSLNDTIVVFDRIREVRGKRTEITADMINTSISQTLSRTILTSVTTFIVVFILYCFGGEAIHGFAFALTVGIIVGTYSSIFIASPVLLWLMNTVGLNPGVVDPVLEKGA